MILSMVGLTSLSKTTIRTTIWPLDEYMGTLNQPLVARVRAAKSSVHAERLWRGEELVAVLSPGNFRAVSGSFVDMLYAWLLMPMV
jgi:hypothetical protein